MEEPFLKPINLSVDDMDKFEVKGKMKKRQFAKTISYDWLTNYVSKPI